jgi:lipopolysaccharide export system protein LptA
MQIPTSKLDRSWAWLLLFCSIVVVAPMMSATAGPKAQGLLIQAQTQEADAKTEVVTARGNVRLNYSARQLQARANLAQYYTKQRKVILTGNVLIVQNGNSIQGESITYLIDEGKFIATPKTKQQIRSTYLLPDENGTAEKGANRAVTIQSNTQEANTKTEVIVAQGNVRVSYPARKVQAKGDRAIYNIKQKQITLSGNVWVVNDGSSLQGDIITYSIDSGKFIAKNKPGTPVQSIYILPN